MRFVVLLISAVALALTPAAASARQVDPRGHYGARLYQCDTTGQAATFRGSMAVFRGAMSGLEMKFVLQTRNVDGKFANAGAPTFGVWLAAEPGRERYVYDKGVQNLQVGFTYRAVVRFRWRGADGAIAARAVRNTKPCSLPAANLNVIGLTAGTTDSEGMRPYTVTYINDGDADTGDFGIGLAVDGASLGPQTDSLAAGERSSATFFGPACTAGQTLTATLDVAGLVPESDETDNTYEAPCPT
jgi:hypothetical protein